MPGLYVIRQKLHGKRRACVVLEVKTRPPVMLKCKLSASNKVSTDVSFDLSTGYMKGGSRHRIFEEFRLIRFASLHYATCLVRAMTADETYWQEEGDICKVQKYKDKIAEVFSASKPSAEYFDIV